MPEAIRNEWNQVVSDQLVLVLVTKLVLVLALISGFGVVKLGIDMDIWIGLVLAFGIYWRIGIGIASLRYY